MAQIPLQRKVPGGEGSCPNSSCKLRSASYSAHKGSEEAKVYHLDASAISGAAIGPEIITGCDMTSNVIYEGRILKLGGEVELQPCPSAYSKC